MIAPHEVWSNLARFFYKRRGHLSLTLTFTFCQALFESLTALLVMPLLVILQTGSVTPDEHALAAVRLLRGVFAAIPRGRQLLAICAALLLATAIKNCFGYLANTSINRFQLEYGRGLRRACADRLLELHLSVHQEIRPGEFVSLVNEQTDRSELLVSAALEMTTEGIVILFLGTVLLTLSVPLSLVSTLIMGIAGALVMLLVRRVQAQGGRTAAVMREFSGRISEVLAGIRLVKESREESRERGALGTLLDQRMASEYASFQLSTAVVPVVETIGVSALIILIFLGSFLLSAPTPAQRVTVLGTYLVVLMRIVPRLNHFSSLRTSVGSKQASCQAVLTFLSQPFAHDTSAGREPYRPLRRAVRFEDVSFTYPGKERGALHRVCMEFPARQVTALIGPSGSGKSTVADLLLCFQQASEGRILMDEVDIRDVDLADLRKGVAIVSQETFLFNATVRENIVYGTPEATEADIERAVALAHIREFLASLPEGLETVIGNRGSRLSGGQRQRIAIARAFLKNPDLLILDEATSALDNESERLIQDALETICHNRTVLIIAHRLTTIKKADHIVVLERGEVVQTGSWEFLASQSGTFTRLLAAGA